MRIPIRTSIGLLLVAASTLACGTRRGGASSTSPAGPTAEVESEFLFEAFAPGLSNASGEPVHCETSAAAATGGRVLMATDKPIPGATAFFSLSADSLRPGARACAILAPALAGPEKFEDMAVSPDGRWVWATTGFDRVRDDASWDRFNCLLRWPAGQVERAGLVAAASRGGLASSVGLREAIQEALACEEFPDGPPYFKVEGLCELPGGTLCLGIREWGRTFEDFRYDVAVLAVHFTEGPDGPVLADDWRLLARFEPPLEALGLRGPLGLSSLEYDAAGERVLMTTSYELAPTPEGIGAYLWSWPLPSLLDGRAPELVRLPDGQPLRFEHKAEAVCALGGGRFLLAHDDDRVLGDSAAAFHRLPHQGALSIIRFR